MAKSGVQYIQKLDFTCFHDDYAVCVRHVGRNNNKIVEFYAY